MTALTGRTCTLLGELFVLVFCVSPTSIFISQHIFIKFNILTLHSCYHNRPPFSFAALMVQNMFTLWTTRILKRNTFTVEILICMYLL